MMVKIDRTQALRNFLAAGKTVSEAAICAGVTPEDLPEVLAKIEKDRRQDALPMATIGFSRLMTAIDVLEDLAKNAEEDRARVAAAKALVDFALASQKLRTGTEEIGKKPAEDKIAMLWDFT